MGWKDGIRDSMDMSLSKLWDIEGQRSLACCTPRDHRVRHDLATEQQQHIDLLHLGILPDTRALIRGQMPSFFLTKHKHMACELLGQGDRGDTVFTDR